MVQAVVLGANGYIGNAVAVELVSRGYTVYGVVRSGDDKVVRRLRAQEIVPVVASITASDVSSLDSYLTRASVVIDATSQPGGSVDVPRALVRRIEEHAARSQRIVHFLYTSGCLVFDHSSDGATLDETSPHNEQHPRSVFTRELTDTASPVYPHVRSTVLIPAWVYGQSSGQYLSQLSFFPSANTPSPITQYGNPDAVWPWIHVTDLARAYADVVDCGDSRVHGQVFILTDNSTYATRRQIATVLARAAGYKGDIVFAPGLTDPFSLMLEKSIPMFTQKLQQATGWKPRYGPLTDAALAKRVADAQAAAKAQ